MIKIFRKKSNESESLLTSAEVWVENSDKLFKESDNGSYENGHLVSAFLFGNEDSFVNLTKTIPGMVFIFEKLNNSVKSLIPDIGIPFNDLVRPYFFDKSSFKQASIDFPLDLLSMKNDIVHLYGDEIVNSYELDRDNLKSAVLRELNSVYINLMSLSVISDDERRTKAVFSLMNRLLGPFRGLLVLREAGHVSTWGSIVSAVESSCGISGFPFTQIISFLEKGEMEELGKQYESIIIAIEELIVAVSEI